MKLFEIGKIYRLINKPLSEQQSDPLLPYREEFRLDLFLTGQRFPESWRHKTEPFDFYDIRYYVDAVFHRLGIKTNQYVLEESNDNWFDFGLHYTSGGSSFASFGKLNTQITKHFDIKKDVFYATLAWETLLQVAGLSTTRYNEVPKFPAVRRDLALVLEKHVSFDDVKKIARESEPYLLSEVNLFDVYEGDKIPQGKKSYAVSFIILDKEKTLTDKIIDQVMGKILRQFEQKLGASLR
jgi:phenylalanyl-tRNA synthetase beta chain